MLRALCQAGAAVKIIQYWIYLEQPLLATALQGDPNSSISFDYIPGSQIRGLLIHRYIGRNGLQASDVAGNADCRRLFFDGTTRYLNAYLLTKNAQRSLPTPLALRKQRSDESGRAYNASHPEWNDDMRLEAEDDDQLKGLDASFCVQNGDGSLTLYKPQPNTVSIHVLRERPKGRATPDQGAVFQYDALSPGQWFAGVILVDADDDYNTIRGLLEPQTAWLGRSRSAEYGRVRIELQPEHTGSWREAGGYIPRALGTHATITLLSDTIVRDESGNVVSKLTDETLSRYLGATVSIRAYHSFSESIPHGGFNRTWQMPLVQTPALKAGSVIAFELSPDENLNLARLEEQGIGEGRAEGLGRVAFDWITEVELKTSSGEGYRVSLQRNTSTNLSAISQTLAQRMARQLLAAQVEQDIILFVRDKSVTNAPRNSQLARVRVLIRRAIRHNCDLSIVRSGIQSFKDVARQQFQAAYIENDSLWEWLNRLLADPAFDTNEQPLPSYETVWEKLKQLNTSWPSVGGEVAQKDSQLSRATALRLIDAVLAAATRANKRADASIAQQEAHI